MYAIEFETDVKDKYIKIPDDEYENFKFKHVKVIIMAETESINGEKYNVDYNTGKCNG